MLYNIWELQWVLFINQLSHFAFKEMEAQKFVRDLLQVIWRGMSKFETWFKAFWFLSAVLFPIHHSAPGIFQLASSYKSFDIVNEWTFN